MCRPTDSIYKIARSGAAMIVAALLVLPVAWPEPLSWDGVEGLYQRVLTRPGAELSSAMGRDGKIIPVFSTYYVFAREGRGDDSWLQIGPNADDSPIGWVKGEFTVDWRQSLTLALTPKPDDTRTPVLFFKDQSSLSSVISDSDRPSIVRDLVASGRKLEALDDIGVVAMQPETVPSFRESFYLLPILDNKRIDVEGIPKENTPQILKVASLLRGGDEALSPRAPLPDTGAEELEDSEFSIVFVIDTTTSMENYIARTHQAVERIFNSMQESGVGDKVKFGLVGYRDDPDAAPGLEYRTKVFYRLDQPFNPTAFLEAIQQMEVAKVSSKGFDEDAIAGIKEATRLDGWKESGARYIVLITDAGVREPGDGLDKEGLSVEGLVAQAGDIHHAPYAIIPFFLETSQGQRYHEGARDEHKTLSKFGDDAPLYYRVPNGDLSSFGSKIDRLVDQIVRQIDQASRGKYAGGTIETLGDDVSEADRKAIASLDRAVKTLQLVELGKSRKTSVPVVHETWLADFDLVNPNAPMSVETRVLLTRNQLNNLYGSLSVLKDGLLSGGSEALTEDVFFAKLRSTLVRAETDPSTLESVLPGAGPVSIDLDSVEDLGDLVDPYIEHLPYKSALLQYSTDELSTLDIADLLGLVREIESKMSSYRDYATDNENWIRLSPEATSGEFVYPIPLDMLP